MNAKLYTAAGAEKGVTALPEDLFGQQVHEHLLWLSVKRHLGNQRQGTAKVKTRGEVSGGGRKPWRQKGTGRARAGSNTSPLWPGGGRAFGPRPRDYRTGMPRRQRRQALVAALSLKAGENAVSVLESLEVKEAKTREVSALLSRLGLGGKKTLLVLARADDRVLRACRNLPRLRARIADQLNPYELLDADAVLLTAAGLDRVREVYAR